MFWALCLVFKRRKTIFRQSYGLRCFQRGKHTQVHPKWLSHAYNGPLLSPRVEFPGGATLDWHKEHDASCEIQITLSYIMKGGPSKEEFLKAHHLGLSFAGCVKSPVLKQWGSFLALPCYLEHRQQLLPRKQPVGSVPPAQCVVAEGLSRLKPVTFSSWCTQFPTNRTMF